MTRFKAWLSKRGLSIEGFASETGIGYTTVRGWAVDAKRPRAMARMIIRSRFPDCPLAAEARPRAPLAMNRRVARRFRGYPDEDQNEGHAEHAAMSPEERLELTGFILRQYAVGILNLPQIPRLDRSAARLVPRGFDE